MKFTNWTKRNPRAGSENTPESAKIHVQDYISSVGGELFEEGSIKININRRVWNKDCTDSRLEQFNLMISAADLEAAGYVRKES